MATVTVTATDREGHQTSATVAYTEPSTGGFPDASNTGVVPGTVLKRVPQDVTSGTGWHWDSRGWAVIDGAGAVFNGFHVAAEVGVYAAGCTVSNCKITGTGNGFGVAVRHANNTTIRNCEISGLQPAGGPDPNRLQFAVKDVYQDTTGTQVVSCHIYDTADSISLVTGLIQDNYVHSMGFIAADHIDCILNGGGGNGMVIRHNTLLNEQGQTAAIAVYNQTFGPPLNVTIDNNLVAGGGYCVYGGGDGPAQESGIKITNNHFSTRFFPNGGQFGPVAHFTAGSPGNVWAGNVWADGPKAGQTV